MVAPKKKVDKFAGLTTGSDELWLEDLNLMFYGVPGARKSFLALSASEFFPDELPAKKMVDLEDVVVFLWDQGGLRGLKELGLRIPEGQVMALYKYRRDDIFLAAAKAAEELEKLIEKRGVKWFIHDTVSTLDRRLTVHWKAVIEKIAKEKGEKSVNKYAYLDGMLNSHTRYFDTFTRFPGHNIFLAHARPVRQGEDAQTQNTNRAKMLPGFAAIEPMITGSAKDQYLAECDIIGSVVFDTKKKESMVYPNGGRGYEGRSRLTRFLKDEEPAHLRKMLAKVKEGVENEVGV